MFVDMALTLPKRLLNILSMKVEMYEDIRDCVKKYGYICVSHVWGIQKMYAADKLGIKDGVYWEIPLSDPTKICRLRKAMIKHRKKYCWLDVLCMPQHRQDEINLEIPLMGDYYSGAKMTFVLSTVACTISEDFTKWSDMMSNIMKIGRIFTVEEYLWIDLYYHKSRNPNREHATRFSDKDSLLNISKDEWFERVWTLQEAILSKKLILVSINGIYIELSDVLNKVLYMESLSSGFIGSLFGNSGYNLIRLGNAISQHKIGIRDLILISGWSVERKCHKPHDKFYGILGILGYKDFVVDYDINIDDLNKKIIQHAYSKRDVSWMAVCGSIRPGFIQPIYKAFTGIGELWGIGLNVHYVNVVDEALSVYATSYATIICCEKPAWSYTNPIAEIPKFLAWVIHVFRCWEFEDDDIISAITGFRVMSDVAIKVSRVYLDCLSRCMTPHATSSLLGQLFGIEALTHKHDFEKNLQAAIYCIYLEASLVMATLDETGKKAMFIIAGNADIGDKILLTRICDNKDRILGIIASGSLRKGVFLYKKVEIPKYYYTTHKFLL